VEREVEKVRKMGKISTFELLYLNGISFQVSTS
jgi:hypothetical protein